MNFEVILYIIIGIVYAIYSLYEQAKKKAKERDAVPGAKTEREQKPQRPFGDIFKEIMEQMEEKTPTDPFPLPPRRKEVTLPKKDLRKPAEAPATEFVALESIEKEGLTRNEPITSVIEVQSKEEARPNFKFDAREAMIYSIIMERKYQ